MRSFTIIHFMLALHNLRSVYILLTAKSKTSRKVRPIAFCFWNLGDVRGSTPTARHIPHWVLDTGGGALAATHLKSAAAWLLGWSSQTLLAACRGYRETVWEYRLLKKKKTHSYSKSGFLIVQRPKSTDCISSFHLFPTHAHLSLSNF